VSCEGFYAYEIDKNKHPRWEYTSMKRVKDKEEMLTSNQVCQFEEQGFTIVRGLVSPEELTRYTAEIGEISEGQTLAQHNDRVEMETNQEADGILVRRIYEPCSNYLCFRELAESSKVLDCLEALIGPDILFHYSKINMKLPGVGSVVEWHQDLAYDPLTNHDSVTVLFYLDDANEENGALLVLPGRHKGPMMCHSEDGFFRGKVTEEMDRSAAIALTGKAGDVIFMSSKTPHASVTNSSESARRTVIVGYRAADAFPVYFGPKTHEAELMVRQVRGVPAENARFEGDKIAIPQYLEESASLYKLQEQTDRNEPI